MTLSNEAAALLTALRSNVVDGHDRDGFKLTDNQNLYGFGVRQIKGLYSKLSKAGLYLEVHGIGFVKPE